VFVSGKAFQPTLTSVGKARTLPCSGTPERCFTLIEHGFTRQHLTRLEGFASNKHSSLLGPFINCKECVLNLASDDQHSSKRHCLYFTFFLLCLLLFSCGKQTHPWPMFVAPTEWSNLVFCPFSKY